MLKLGLTGGIGSGKSFVAACFSALGIQVINADTIARQFTRDDSPFLAEIFAHFGEHLKQPDGGLDRKKLRSRIFANDADKTWLENLLHPPIRAEIVQQLHNAKPPYAILESPLLLETDQHRMVDFTLVVDVPEALQLERAATRDNVTAKDIAAIIKTQVTRTERLRRADFIVDNSGSFADTERQVLALHEKLKGLAAERGAKTGRLDEA